MNAHKSSLSWGRFADEAEALGFGLAMAGLVSDEPQIMTASPPALVVNLQFPATVLDENTWCQKQARSVARSSKGGTGSAASPVQSSLLTSRRHLLWGLGRSTKAPFRPTEPAANGWKWWDNSLNKPVQPPWELSTKSIKRPVVSKCGTPFHASNPCLKSLKPYINGLVCWGKSTPETHGFLPSNWSGFSVKIFPSSNSMIKFPTD